MLLHSSCVKYITHSKSLTSLYYIRYYFFFQFLIFYHLFLKLVTANETVCPSSFYCWKSQLTLVCKANLTWLYNKFRNELAEELGVSGMLKVVCFDTLTVGLPDFPKCLDICILHWNATYTA